MSIQTRIKQVEEKVKRQKELYIHSERPIIELPEELKKKYKILPYPIMGGLSAE